MNRVAFVITILLSVSLPLFSQNLKVENIIPLTDLDYNIDVPTDLNGKKCVVIEVMLVNQSVVFEGNIIGTPKYYNERYYVFLSPNSRYLNIKYPTEKPLMVKFSDYNIASLPSSSILRIEMTEPSAVLSDQLDSNIAEVSKEAEALYDKGGELLMQNNYISAFEYFTKAYELGHPKAAYQLGFIYSDPYHSVRGNKLVKGIVDIPENPVKRNLEKAFSYYKQSAEAGYVTAQYAIGECFEKGDGVKKSKEEALRWYGKAAAQGHLQAKEKIGEKIKKNRMMGVVTSYGTSNNEFVLNSIECDVNDLSAITNGRKDKTNQFCAVVKILLPFNDVKFVGDTIGNPLFKTNEYWVYLPQDTKEIEIYYSDFKPLKINFKSMGIDRLIGKNTYNVSISFPIDLLNDDVEISADNLYKIGLGFMERRDNQYIRWMKKSADKGYPKAMYQLGSCYLYGNGLEKDKNKGISLLKRASNAGEAEASYYLGQYYELMGKDKKNAQIWYDKAAEQGYEPAKGKKAKKRKMFNVF